MMWDGAMGWHWVGWLGMVIFWLLIVLLVLVALKYLRSEAQSDRSRSEQGKTAMQYLEEAYAKGEISREEFLQKREDLRADLPRL